MRSKILALAALVLITANAPAAFLIRYDLNSGSAGPGTSSDPNISGSAITLGPGITAVPSPNSLESSGWTTGTEPNDLDYYTLTLTPAAGYSFSLTSLQFADLRDSNGPTRVVLQTSLGGFGSSGDYIFPDDNVVLTQEINRTVTFDSSFTDITGPLEIRIYAYAATNADGTYQLRNFNPDPTNPDSPTGFYISGDIGPSQNPNPVPAPASLGLLALGAPAFLFIRRRTTK